MDFSANEKECVIVWEKKKIVEEKAKEGSLKLPSTFFCGVCGDTDEDNENGEDFQSELQNVQEAQKSQSEEITSRTDSVYTSETEVIAEFFYKSEERDSITKPISSSSVSSGTVGKPVDLSTRKENDTESTSQVKTETVSFRFGSGRGLSFADLASSISGDFAFGPKVDLPTYRASSRPQTECCNASDSSLKSASCPKSKVSYKQTLLPHQIN